MEGLLSTLKEIEPFVTILGFGVTIYLLIWRIPSKAEINRIADNIQEKIGEEASSGQEQIENETSNLQKQIDKVFATSLAITNEIREDMRSMQSQIVRLGEKIDANSQAIHADISKLTAKIEVVSHALQAEVGNRGNQESPSQS